MERKAPCLMTTNMTGADPPEDELDLLLRFKRVGEYYQTYIGFPYTNVLAFRPDLICFNEAYPVRYAGTALADLPNGYYYVQILVPMMPEHEARKFVSELISTYIEPAMSILEMNGESLCNLH